MISLAIELQNKNAVQVKYEQLVNIAVEADAQKDILSQMLRKAFPNPEYFSENNDLNATKIIVRCVSCQHIADAVFIPKSLKQKNTVANNARYEFLVKNTQSEQVWTVDILKPQTRFALVANHSFFRGQEIQESDLSLTQCFVTESLCVMNGFDTKENAEKEKFEIIGATASNQTAEGTFFTKNRVTRTPLIRPRDTVRVLLSSASGLQIKATGKAISSGFKGGVVRVEVDDGKNSYPKKSKTIEATVTAAGEARYEY